MARTHERTNKDTEVSLQLTDDEHEDAKTAAKEAARLLINVREHRRKNENADRTVDSTKVA